MQMKTFNGNSQHAAKSAFESDLEAPRTVASEAFGRVKKGMRKMQLATGKPEPDLQKGLKRMCRHRSEDIHIYKEVKLTAGRLAYAENGGGSAIVFSESEVTCASALEKSVDSIGYKIYTVATVENAEFSRKGALGFKREAGDYKDIGGHLNGLAVRHARANYSTEMDAGSIELMNGHVDSKHGDYFFRFFAGNFWFDGSLVRCDYHMVIEGEILTDRLLGGILEQGGTISRHLKKEFEKMGAAAKKMFPSELWDRVMLENVISR